MVAVNGYIEGGGGGGERGRGYAIAFVGHFA